MYRAGWGRQEIDIAPQGYAMFGYGMPQHRAQGRQTPLFARALYLADENGRALLFCCFDLGCITHAMRAGIVAALRVQWGGDFDEAGLVLTATHTHSGPGGCSHEALYNMPTPGFVPGHLEKAVAAGVAALLAARTTAAATELGFTQGRFGDEVPVAWNRSIEAWNRNPDVTPRSESETHLALNRDMQLLGLRRNGRPVALLSLFGVHATCLGNTLQKHDGDNKGYAAAQAEQALAAAGAEGAVAIFAQATAGDVSPHYQGPGDIARRKQIRGEAEYAYAAQNGRYQSEQALALLAAGGEEKVAGGIDAVLTYVDFTAIHADARFADGETEAWTSEPCHGVAFARGTRVDGPGMPALLGAGAATLAAALKRKRLGANSGLGADEQAHYRRLYAAQGEKDILIEAGRKLILGRPVDRLPVPGFADPLVKELKRQARIGALVHSPFVPTVLPLQIVTVGQLALVCCPGEFTTTAGARLIATVREQLRNSGIRHVLICTYCNDYMGYVTTQQEYRLQCYEGGHTLFGQWTLAAFQTRFAALAAELQKPAAVRGHDTLTRPPAVPADELARRSA
jgi:neutral ceramidase